MQPTGTPELALDEIQPEHPHVPDWEPLSRGGDASTPRRRCVPGDRKTLRLTLVLAITSAVMLALVVPASPSASTSLRIPFAVMAIAFAVSELMVLRLGVGDEGRAFTFDEIPLVVGLAYAAPLVLVAGRLVGAGLVQALRHRGDRVRCVFHLGLLLAECAVAISVFGTLRGDAGMTDPRSWVAALAAVLVVDATRAVCVSTVRRWHGSTPDPHELLLVGGITAVTNTTLGLVAVLLLEVDVAAITLLVVPALILCAAYRAFTSLAQRHEKLGLLYDFTRSVGLSTGTATDVRAVLDRARATLRAEHAEVLLLAGDDDRGTVRVSTDDGIRPNDPGDPGSGSPDRLLESVIERGQVVRLGRDEPAPDHAGYLAARGYHEIMVAPLRTQHGVIGALAVANRVGGTARFGANDARLLETLANHAAVALENGRLVDELSREVRERHFEARHDELTGLPNRACFFERLAEHLDRADGSGCVVMLLDLDRFKDVNDTLGHHSGDVLLACVARRLRRALDARATVARLGGDEFAVLVPGVADRSAAMELALHLRYVLDEPFEVEGHPIASGGSVGVALGPSHALDAASLMKCADIAMYAAKKTDEGVQVYAPERGDTSIERVTLTPALQRALRDATLTVEYQAQVRMRDGSLAGVEALARWHHAELGVVPPNEFVPVAERAGLVGALARHVLREALAQRRLWADEGHDVPVSVNLSPRNVLDGSLPHDIRALLLETGTPPSALTLELTESAMLDQKRGEAFLEELAAMGVRISVDDFGTGYSSLSCLHRLPVNEVKIDRSFVLGLDRDPGNLPIVRSIIDLGHHLGLAVVAEGVEDGSTFERLRSMGCDIAQGFFLARPAPPAGAARRVHELGGPGRIRTSVACATGLQPVPFGHSGTDPGVQ